MPLAPLVVLPLLLRLELLLTRRAVQVHRRRGLLRGRSLRRLELVAHPLRPILVLDRPVRLFERGGRRDARFFFLRAPPLRRERLRVVPYKNSSPVS
eukprot:31412-Pelagococcus_subviridis.AAC.3